MKAIIYKHKTTGNTCIFKRNGERWRVYPFTGTMTAAIASAAWVEAQIRKNCVIVREFETR